MREELLKRLKALGDLNLYLKLKDKSNDVIEYYLPKEVVKVKKKKVEDSDTESNCENI